MTNDKPRTLREMILDAYDRGMTRGAVAQAVGCSRVHLWRLENGQIREDTNVGKRVRAVLGGSASLYMDFDQALDDIIRSDPERRAKLLQMLHMIADLSGEPLAEPPSHAPERNEKGP